MDFIDPVAQAKYSELCSLREFTAYELDQLAAYCSSYSRWRAAEEWLSDPAVDENGNPTRGHVATILDDKGNIKTILPSPQIGIAERASREMARIGKALRLHRRPDID